MPIKQITPQSEVDKYTEQQVSRIEKLLVYNLSYVGEQVLNAARNTNSYKDQTGNLRSSIGYVVVLNGIIKTESSFKSVKQGAQGATNGKSYAKELIQKYPQGICLIVVAGMDYAVHVANMGYDVLDSSELLARRLVLQLLSKLKIEGTI